MLYVKLLLALVVIGGLAGGVTYVYKLKADLATSEANNAKLENSVEEQKLVIAQQILDMDNIRAAMKEQAELSKRLNASIKDLRNKFNKVNASGEKRDIGNLAEQKPKLMQRAINRGTKNALRCMEIAMGSPLTEKEKNAVKKSQINPECPDVANPNYVPYGN
jgi:uncharacterized membrane protein|tara:strand:+ start:412 stop:900 length:489 start_codon:yes stop_codon:yes gene_type:complete